MSTLQGRIALVTGASRGVGRAIALRLATDGAAVAVNYRKEAAAADELVAGIRQGGGTAAAFCASVDDEAAVVAMVDDVRRQLGPVDLLVSNAGVASRGRLIADTKAEEFLSLLGVHALGPVRLIQALLPEMRLSERSDVVVISSDTVAGAPAHAAPYTMAKAAMETCARTLAREERANGVRVNIVAPGLVATDMGRRLVTTATGGGNIAELDGIAAFGRVCRPEDVAGAVAYLVSAEGSYVTGQTLVVNGGGASVSIF
jgi:NAD(P)-dependent dehydrogenase (short-subunit alcohol dehydrogenase family)